MSTRKKLHNKMHMARKKRSVTMRFLDDLIGEALTFGSMLRAIRECEEISQTEMARRLGISRAHLCDIEKGRRTVSPARAVNFARALDYGETQFVRLALQDQVTEAGLRMTVKVEAA